MRYADMNPSGTSKSAAHTATKVWRVVRTVREYFEVEASTRAEALLNASDPHTVILVRETAVVATPDQPTKDRA